MAIPSFVDRVTLTVQAGSGGNGCASVRREKFKPLGGPDGGNGGDGGSVVFRVDDGLTTLLEFHRQSLWKATGGQPGQGHNRNGANGDSVVLEVPKGTVVSDARTGEILADLTRPGDEFVAAAGGKGGLGNAALASRARKAPGFALLGEEGTTAELQLELKVVADVGLVGFPSAGKSSLIAAISRAKPEIADYPFTTLVPNLGVVVAGDVTYTVADVPGLIEGASAGRGLGLDFLRHIERCQAIVHVIDLGTYEPGRDPVGDLRVIENELAAHGGLEDRIRLIALNKMDLPDAPELAAIATEELRDVGWPIFQISTKTGQGLDELRFALADVVKARRAAEAKAETPRVVIRPKPVGRRSSDRAPEFTIKQQGDGEGGLLWRVRGEKPERWIKQTDFGNPEAVGYLADRLFRLGVEAKLLELGAEPGDAVAIGGEDAVVFDFVPQVDMESHVMSRRGDDPRFEEQRPAVARRREANAQYWARKAAEAAGQEENSDE